MRLKGSVIPSAVWIEEQLGTRISTVGCPTRPVTLRITKGAENPHICWSPSFTRVPIGAPVLPGDCITVSTLVQSS